MKKRYYKLLFVFSLIFIIILMGSSLVPSAQLWAETPKRGGKLVVSVPSAPRKLDPAKQWSYEEYLNNYWMFNALTFFNWDMSISPELATSWESSSDLKEWTFYLRKGVKFHHGRELVTDDVVFSIQRIMDPKIGSPATESLRIVDRIEAADKYTVKFYLKIPYANFPAVLASREIKIVPRDKVNTLQSHPIGTGPFKFKEYMFGDHFTVIRNENYWKKGLPYLDEIEERIIPEVPVQVSALKSGEIDILWQVPPESIRELSKVQGVKVQEIPAELWDAVCMDSTMEPFDDVNVRLAIKYALNKYQLTEYALFGHGEIVNELPLSPSNQMYPSNIPIPEQNYEKAKDYLKKAGLEKGFDIKLYVSPSRPTRDRLGIAVQQMLKPLNIRVQIVRVPWDKFVADVEGKVAFYTDGFYAAPTVDLALYPYYHSTGSWNLWHWKDKKTDELLEKARKQKSVEDQKKAYEEFAKYMGTVASIYIPYVRNWADAHREYVKNFRSHPGGFIYADNIWLDK